MREIIELLRASSFSLQVARGDRQIVSMNRSAEPRDRPEWGLAAEWIGRRRWGFRCCGRFGRFGCLCRCRYADADERRTDNDPEQTMTAHVKHVPYF